MNKLNTDGMINMHTGNREWNANAEPVKSMQNTNTWEKLGAAIAGYSAPATRDNYREIIINVEKIEKEAEQRGIQRCIEEIRDNINLYQERLTNIRAYGGSIDEIQRLKTKISQFDRTIKLLSSLQDNNKDHA